MSALSYVFTHRGVSSPTEVWPYCFIGRSKEINLMLPCRVPYQWVGELLANQAWEAAPVYVPGHQQVPIVLNNPSISKRIADERLNIGCFRVSSSRRAVPRTFMLGKVCSRSTNTISPF